MIAAFALLVFMMPSMVGWGQTTVTWPGTTALPGTATAVANDANITIKVSSTNTYTSPIRIYANTTVTINANNGAKITSVAYEASSTGNYVTYAQNATVTPSVTPTVSGKIVTWSYEASANVTEFTFKPSTQTRSNGISITYVTSGSSTIVATPTFTLDSEITDTTTYSGDVVRINCQTEGASIYYTTSNTTTPPDDPTSQSTLYNATDGIELTENTTIKAIAIKEGMTNSNVASKSYKVLTPLTTMEEIFDAATDASSTATDVAVTFDDWIVAGKTNNNAYVTDGQYGLTIYQSSHGFNSGDELSGTVICKVQLYNGGAELTNVNASSTGLTVTANQAIPGPYAVSLASISGAYIGSYVDLGNLTYSNGVFTDGNGHSIQPYNSFNISNYPTSFSGVYRVKGVYIVYGGNATVEIAPIVASDFTQVQLYAVTYNGNGSDGGTTPVDPNSPYTSGSTVTVLGNTFTKTGHTFDYWTKDAEGNVGPYVEGDEFEITANTTFYAQWGANLHDYSLTVTGADNQAEAELYVDNSAVAQGAQIAYGKEVSVVVAVSTGYSYTIEVKDANNTPIAVENDKFTMPDSDVAVTVTTTQVSQHTITFNAGSGSCNTASVTEYEGTSITLPTANPPATCATLGWTFAGWATSSVSETTTAPTLLNGSYTMGGSDATLYAVYTLIEGSDFDNTAGGDFLIYAAVTSDSKTVTNFYASGTGSKISTVTDSDDATVYTFEKLEGQNYGEHDYAIKCTINNTTSYITYSGSSTNLGTADDPYIWTISSGEIAGSWHLLASTTANANTVRGLIFQNYSTNNNTTTYTHQFGAYAVGNVDGDDYYDVEIGGGSTTTYNSNPACTLPTATITVDPTSVEVDAAGTDDGTLALSYEYLSISAANDFAVQFYDENEDELNVAPDWITAAVEDVQQSGYKVSYIVDENEDNSARTAYFKVFAMGNEDYVYSDLITITQAAAPQQYTLTVTLAEHVSAIYVFNAANQNDPLIAEGAAGNVQVLEGTEILVSPDVAEGYVLQSLLVGGTDVTSQMTEGSYTFTMTGNVTITAIAEANPYLTATLSSSNMQTMTNAGSGYGSLKYTTVNNFYWETTGYQTSSNNVVYGMIQLKKRDGNNYINLPEFPGKIESITLAVTAASANTSNGTACTATLAFQAGNTSSENVIVSNGNSSGTNEITLDLSNKFYSTGYITVTSSTGARIWNIDVTYRPYQNVSGSTLPATIGNDVTVSIPANTSITNTSLTIPANSGIIIKSGAKLTVTGTLTNNGTANNIVIEDGGQLVYYDNGGKDAVKATAQKEILGYGNDNTVKTGWNFIASPITESFAPASTTMTSNNYDLYQLNPSNTKWENYKDNEGHTNAANGFSLANGHGYLYANSGNVTLEFAGTIKPFTTEGNANQVSLADGWNLVGNPYTFNVYSSKSYYRITTDNGENVITAVTNTGDYIAPCTGIVVKSTGPGSVAFTETSEGISWATGNNGNLQMTLSQQVTTRGNSSNATLDNAIVSFNEGSQLEKFYFGEQNANIYIPQGNEEYAIVSAEAQGEMPVCFKAKADGQYTISVDAENVEMSYLHLIDNITGADVDLLANPSFTFNAKGDDYASRFRLVFSANNTVSNAENGNFAFISNGEIIVNGEGTVQVIDMLGRELLRKDLSTLNSRLSTLTFKPGVYVLRLIDGTNVMTQKIVVK